MRRDRGPFIKNWDKPRQFVILTQVNFQTKLEVDYGGSRHRSTTYVMKRGTRTHSAEVTIQICGRARGYNLSDQAKFYTRPKGTNSLDAMVTLGVDTTISWGSAVLKLPRISIRSRARTRVTGQAQIPVPSRRWCRVFRQDVSPNGRKGLKVWITVTWVSRHPSQLQIRSQYSWQVLYISLLLQGWSSRLDEH